MEKQVICLDTSVLIDFFFTKCKAMNKVYNISDIQFDNDY